MVENVHSVIEQWTGTAPRGCPWAAFLDPFVVRVHRAVGFCEHGEYDWYAPDPSNRLVEGIAFFKRCLNAVFAKRREQERERSQQQAPTRPGTEVIRG